MPRKKSFEIEVEPKVLKWAIDSSGWKEEELLKRLKISKEIFDKWLSGEVKPTLVQLENLSGIIKRPLAAFLLSEPPPEKPIPKDYRMIPGREGKFNKKTILAIRRARRLQRISGELSENLEPGKKSPITPANLADDPKKLAEKYLNAFQITEETRKKWKTTHSAFNAIRELIEDRNVLVFQIPMPMEDARGFALVDDTPPVVVVNSHDLIEARLFTLMHEFGHVLLKESGVSMPENSLAIRNLDKIEKWCNDFSSAFLLPEHLARIIFNEYKSDLTGTGTLRTLSGRYKVSKAMLLYSMSKLNYITQTEYDSVIGRYKPGMATPPKVKKTGKSTYAGMTADKRCFNERGQKFVSLVATNVEKGYITHSDALNYLSIKSRNLGKVISGAKK
jgi:Zn-dependent peptidase ImmA (M78 family)